MRFLTVIPARKGSKGIPGKNSKILVGKPLIQYSIETALQIAAPADICVTTDSEEIIEIAESLGLKVPFIRPDHLASDTSGSREVLLHAVDFYAEQGNEYDAIVLLQPTSPFRKTMDIMSMINHFDESTDMVVSVKECHDNPYYSMFEENESGYLKLSKEGQYTRRQDCPKVYAFNGSVYVIRTSSLREKPIGQFGRIKKFVMDDIHSLDIDTPFDWSIAEMMLEKKMLNQS